MSLWGNSPTNQQEPKYLANVAQPYGDMFQRYAEVYADNTGWQIVYPNANTKTECLVAIGLLAKTLGAPKAVQAYFNNPTANATTIDANTAGRINVAFTQQLTLITATAPTVNLTQTGAISSNVLATYAAGNGTSILQFTFTTPTDFQGNTNANTVITFAGQQMVIVAEKLRAKTNINTNANTYIPDSANTNYPFAGRTPTIRIQHPITYVSNVNFASGNTIARNTASNIYVNFAAPVNVLTATAPIIRLNVVAGNTTNATYASGNGTSNLRFTWTSPQFVANVVSVANSVSILTGTINDLMNAAVNTYFTTAITAASGIVTPT